MPGKASWNDFTPLRPTLESGQIDQKPYVQIGWVLRETTCWNEYAFLDSPDQVCFISKRKTTTSNFPNLSYKIKALKETHMQRKTIYSMD